MSNKPYSRYEWKVKACPDCKGRGGFGDGDDFELCWNCDDGKIPYEVEIDMTQEEWDDYHRKLRDEEYLTKRYGPFIHRRSIADYWRMPTQGD